jgi:putative Holliday junction resolvase
VRRILGADLGERRIGLAVADRDGGLATALVTIRRSTTAQEAAAITRIAIEQDADALVVGVPLHAAGAAGTQAEITRDWAPALEPLVGLTITLRYERLTSHLAEERVGPMKRGRSGGPPSRTQRDAHRGRVDREAAAIILQDELDARAAAQVNPATHADPADQAIATTHANPANHADPANPADGGTTTDEDMESTR